MLPLRLVEDACQNTRQHPLHLRTPSYGRSGQFRLRHQRRQTAGRITAAGMTKEVTFEPVGGPVNDLVDDAYRAKYHCSPYLKPMIGARARSATIKVMPRQTTA